jgi:hypothetical protein
MDSDETRSVLKALLRTTGRLELLKNPDEVIVVNQITGAQYSVRGDAAAIQRSWDWLRNPTVPPPDDWDDFKDAALAMWSCMLRVIIEVSENPGLLAKAWDAVLTKLNE